MKQFNPDKKPDSWPKDVWDAYRAWNRFNGRHEDRLVLWDKLLEVKGRYTVKDGKWVSNEVQGTLF